MLQSVHSRQNYIFKMNALRQIFNKKQRISPNPLRVTHWLIDNTSVGQRIDNFLLRIAKGVPKSHIYRILRSGEVRVNQGRVDAAYRLSLDDKVRIPPLRMAIDQESKDQESKSIFLKKDQLSDFSVLYEDADLLVINKIAGIAVHGGSGVSYGVIEQMRYARPAQKFLELAHRLDRETSGILLLAKKRSALLAVHKQMRDGLIDKRYLVCVRGEWPTAHNHLTFPLLKYHTHEGERRVRVQEGGQFAHTIIKRLQIFKGFSLLEAQLKTGRMHQIRVHLAHSGYPIVGDDKYGDFAFNRELVKASGKYVFKRMFLHASQIQLVHPSRAQPLILEAPLPEECQRFLQWL